MNISAEALRYLGTVCAVGYIVARFATAFRAPPAFFKYWFVFWVVTLSASALLLVLGGGAQ